MKPTLNSLVEARIQELSRRLIDHRKKHGSGCHPSREIWERALALCEQAPLSRVAHGIGVSPNGLRNWKSAARCPAVKGVEPRQPQFLEVRSLEATGPLLAPAASNQTSLKGASISRQVELQRSDGSCLKIADPGAHGLDLRVLIQGFMTSMSTSSPAPTSSQEGGLQ